MANRQRPALAATVPASLADFARKQAESRGVTISSVISEALELMQVGMVYQIDTKRLISISDAQQKQVKQHQAA
ncbi:hypothetical protein [Gloeocapsopsis dulcis]|uniref:Uncharacterized protein n=1 Tax=Gloeocapsopsis dulcis AAB1 = 1H9 TaxID=1433147 RepID=A0A6N8G230_9CHRO|nr:hypothetical protein [Gloeocapsopsis dulcis]MUL38952.1 hypothetical protein [Gloeocapsopsis dulcis AAB1 = 1H9]WNN89554.1 hypothetical protein P0S91_00130 [Gloeocapsopsis dulcis]